MNISPLVVAGCNGVTTYWTSEDNADLRSPGYSNGYENDDSCFWEIVVPEGEIIRFYITGFALGTAGEDCTQYDYIEVSYSTG